MMMSKTNFFCINYWVAVCAFEKMRHRIGFIFTAIIYLMHFALFLCLLINHMNTYIIHEIMYSKFCDRAQMRSTMWVFLKNKIIKWSKQKKHLKNTLNLFTVSEWMRQKKEKTITRITSHKSFFFFWVSFIK